MPEGWRTKAGLLSRALIDNGRGTAFSLKCRLTNTLRKYVKINSSIRIETCLAAHYVVDKAFTESFLHRGGEVGEVVGPAAPAQRLASALALETNSETFFRTIRNAVSVDAAGARREIPCPVVGGGVQSYLELRAGLHLPGPELQRPLKTSHVCSIVILSRMMPVFHYTFIE